MMIYKKIVFVLLYVIVLTTGVVNAQIIQRLKVGDHVPDILFKRVLNYPSDTLKLSNFKGKAIVIDIWSRYCSSCISAFPKMHEIAKLFPNELQVLLVTRDSQDDFNKIGRRSPIVKAATLPIILEDTLIRKLFPSTGLPWQVWIDSKGVVQAIHSGKETTAESIAAFLNGKVSPKLKKDINIKFDPNKDLLDVNNRDKYPTPTSYSLFMNEFDDISRSWLIHPIDSKSRKITGIRLINTTLDRVCTYLFSSKMPREYSEGINKLTRFCYELKLPETKWGVGGSYGSPEAKELKNHIYTYMKNDLCRYFNISFDIRQRPVEFLKLIRIDTCDNNFEGIKGNSVDVTEEYFNNRIILRNASIHGLLRNLKKIANVDKILLDTLDVYPESINMEVNIPMASSIVAINKELGKYNLSLVKEIQNLDVLIISSSR